MKWRPRTNVRGHIGRGHIVMASRLSFYPYCYKCKMFLFILLYIGKNSSLNFLKISCWGYDFNLTSLWMVSAPIHKKAWKGNILPSRQQDNLTGGMQQLWIVVFVLITVLCCTSPSSLVATLSLSRQPEPVFVNLLRSLGIDSQPSRIDSWAP
jgi:hypothetical protein